MLKPMLLALAQLDEPVFLGVALRSLAWAALAFAALQFGAFWGLHHVVAVRGWTGWWAWAAGLLGGVGAAMLAIWLFLPVAAAIGTFYVDRIAAAVESRYYPWLGAPRGGSAWMQFMDAAAVGIRVLLLSLIAIPIALMLPGPGIVLGWLIAAWAIGRGLFGAVAVRRMSRRDAAVLAHRLRPKILAQGAILAGAGVLPILNLLVPVLGTAAMVHVLHEGCSNGAITGAIRRSS